MGKVAVEHLFNGDIVSWDAYDPTKTVLGALFRQENGYAGPDPIIVTRPFEESASIPITNVTAIDISDTTTWIFGSDAASPATNRRIAKYTYYKDTQLVKWDGFILLPTFGNNHTIRGMRAIREVYSTGTVAVSDTAVTGTGTAWTDRKIAVGARIGFGSTDPNDITTWFYIIDIISNTSITLDRTAGTISAGSGYVVEEIRIVLANTSSSAANGGLFLVKGVNADDFTVAGTSIALASTTDNQKARYWLADASTVTNTISGGLGVGEYIDDDTQYVYVLNVNSTSLVSIYKYNIRASLSSITAGKTTDAFVLKTGTQAAGFVSQNNNGRLVTTGHGRGSGTSSFYFVSAAHIQRAAEADITDGSTTFITDFWAEVPPGGGIDVTFNSIIPSSAGSIEYSSILDKFIITTPTACYLTEYKNDDIEADLIFGARTDQTEQSSADSGIAAQINPTTSLTGSWSEGGVLYLVKSGTLIAQNNFYVIPTSSDWNSGLGDQQRLISPEIDITGAHKLYRLYINEDRVIGSENFGTAPEPFRVFYRTSGISDNSGGWTAVDESGDMTSVTAADAIQFMFEFRILGHFGVAAQIRGLTLVYEDSGNDSHYEPSVKHSDIVNERFAWRFAIPFGTTVPDLRVQLFNAESGASLVDDDTDSPTGTFEQSTDDGTSWVAWTTTDKTNETTYIRYTPSSLTNDVTVRAILTQL